MVLPPTGLARYVDATLLDPAATAGRVESFCAEVVARGCAGLCILPNQVERAAKTLTASRVRVVTVVGFPLGADLPEVKVLAARRAVEQGAAELDMVWNLAAFLEGNTATVEAEITDLIAAANEAAALANRPRPVVKVILECGALTREQMVSGAHLAAEAGAHFVKTSTGMGPAATPATVEQVTILREALPYVVSVKAAGGIATPEQARELVKAGADRLGLSRLEGVLGPAPAH